MMKESETCNTIGWLIMTIGVLAGIVFTFSFGRVEIPRSYYGTETVWSGIMVATGIGIIINSFLVGYLFQKIGSLLRYNEQKSEVKPTND